MVKCEVIEAFTLQRFNELKNLVRKGPNLHGLLCTGDTFECSEDLAKYLTGANVKGKVVVKILEIEPVKQEKTKKSNKKEK